ncbi:MAG: 4-hydroxy-tetrahydrodipicolinate synthase [Anaerocolumna sp.]
MQITGVWLPIITPFKEDKIDYESYKNLIDYYTGKGIDGLIPLGTTGEIPTLSDYEFEEMIEKTMEYNDNRLPVYVGVGGNCTSKVVNKVKIAEKYNIKGILSVCPYYNRPNQEGIYSHFKCVSESTNLNIIIYNIPYRTGVNIENETIYRMAEHKNIVGLKDSCGDIKQSMSLLMNPPKDFSILTGEDLLLYSTLMLGGHGGILASAHLQTEKFVKLYQAVQNKKQEEAFQIWQELYPFIPLLFKEPNPAPIKYVLNKMGLLDSPEVRLPLTQISEGLKDTLNKVLNI